jgi:tetratricopeptide (TPR) repeat protein
MVAAIPPRPHLEHMREVRKLAESARHEGRLDEARRLYEQAVAICRELGDPLVLAHTVRHLGDVHYESGRRELAEPCHVEALAIYREHDPSPLDLANALRSLAITREEGGAFGEAARLWQEAGELYERTGVAAGVAESRRRVARLRSLSS